MLVSSLIHMLLWAVILLSENGMPPLGALKILFFFLGITNTAFVLAWSVAKELTSEKYTGLAISILNAAGFLSIAVCTSVMGWVLDLFPDLTPSGAYRMAFILPLVSAVLSAFSVLFIPETGAAKKRGR